MNEVFKALGDENRLRIINVLIGATACVCDIEASLKLSQTNVSRHLKILRDLRIVKREKKAQWVYYSLDENFLAYKGLLSQLKDEFKKDNYMTDIRERDLYIKKCEEEECC